MDSEAFATLSRIALRADDLFSLADAAMRDKTRIDPAKVWKNALAIKNACDTARRQIAGQAQRVEVVQ